MKHCQHYDMLTGKVARVISLKTAMTERWSLFVPDQLLVKCKNISDKFNLIDPFRTTVWNNKKTAVHYKYFVSYHINKDTHNFPQFIITFLDILFQIY